MSLPSRHIPLNRPESQSPHTIPVKRVLPDVTREVMVASRLRDLPKSGESGGRDIRPGFSALSGLD